MSTGQGNFSFANPIIFLDIDGVLNTHEFDFEAKSNRIDRDKIVILNSILRETHADIVLSSAWRYLVHRGEMNISGLEWLLRSHGMIAGRLIGVTETDTMQDREYDGVVSSWPIRNERGCQISAWLVENNVDSHYLVIDDMDLGISDSGHPFLHVDGKTGLTDALADKAIAMIRSNRSADDKGSISIDSLKVS